MRNLSKAHWLSSCTTSNPRKPTTVATMTWFPTVVFKKKCFLRAIFMIFVWYFVSFAKSIFRADRTRPYLWHLIFSWKTHRYRTRTKMRQTKLASSCAETPILANLRAFAPVWWTSEKGFELDPVSTHPNLFLTLSVDRVVREILSCPFYVIIFSTWK